jgi:hypothetical protein
VLNSGGDATERVVLKERSRGSIHVYICWLSVASAAYDGETGSKEEPSAGFGSSFGCTQ